MDSRKDLLSHLGIPTTREFRESETTTLRSLQFAVDTPEEFGRVIAIETPAAGRIRIIDEEGRSVESKIDWELALPTKN